MLLGLQHYFLYTGNGSSLVVIVFAVWAALTSNLATKRTLDWINVIIGLWLIVSGFILGFSTMAVALWDAIIVGIVMAVLEAWAALALPSTLGAQERDMS